jgi:D-glycero-alpha-D-manno-heptose-7-phosphate kinase
MIVSRTPLRMSFVGGGSDMPEFYRMHGGAVLSTAIEKYVYVNVNRKFDDGIRVAYSRTEEVEHADAVEHPIVRHALKRMGISGGIEITTIADIPSRGTGLGSSSSFAVGLLNALAAFKGSHLSREDLGRESCHIEIELCGEPIGKQDQYAAAFGGLNLIEFKQDDRVVVSPVILRPDVRETLARRLLVFYTGITRSASAVLESQSAGIVSSETKRETLKTMAGLAYRMADELRAGNLDSFGEILHENWELKKGLANAISTNQIDDWYETARRCGAEGGKIMGAGSGGFLLFYAPEDKHDAIKHGLAPLRQMNVTFDLLGSRIMFYDS